MATIIERTGLKDLKPESIVVGNESINANSFHWNGSFEQKTVLQQVLEKTLMGFDATGREVVIVNRNYDNILAAWILKNPSRAFERKTRALLEDFSRYLSNNSSYDVVIDEDKFLQFMYAMEVIMSNSRDSRTAVKLIETFFEKNRPEDAVERSAHLGRS